MKLKIIGFLVSFFIALVFLLSYFLIPDEGGSLQEDIAGDTHNVRARCAAG